MTSSKPIEPELNPKESKVALESSENNNSANKNNELSKQDFSHQISSSQKIDDHISLDKDLETSNENTSKLPSDNSLEKVLIKEYDNLIKYSDETIIDTKTNLMWMVKDFSTIEGRFLKNASWDEAMLWAEKINKRNYAGYNDWKVPSIKEYRSINKDINDRKIYSLLFEDQGACCFWSRNEISSEVKSYISFEEGFAVSGGKEGQRNMQTNEIFKFSVRLVREND